MRQSTESINHILSERISAGRSSALPFTLPEKSLYRADEDTLHCNTTTVNSSLARLLMRNPSDVRSSISSKDLAQLEEALRYLRSIQNFQFWIFGAVSRLLKLSDSAPDRDLLMNQAIYSMQLAMQRAAQVSTTTLSNILMIRKAVSPGLLTCIHLLY
ncbi:hypothetical protein E2C01_090622 [Portunus trituberculatus]|uniref:Uncharacterized protein n=1 Tax=Portunus trituberculatus TaxID=210409 RepID=A0A5B7JH23_PORTR|nr:hypothetical protein [Portunus trituberculatus]